MHYPRVVISGCSGNYTCSVTAIAEAPSMLPNHTGLLPALGFLFWFLMPCAVAGESGDLADAIEQARHLSVTEAVRASQPKIDELMQRLDEATPRQRIEIQLLDIRNQALQGGYAEAIESLQALLDTGLDDDQKLRALHLAANLGINTGRYESGFRQLISALELIPRAGGPVEASQVFGLAAFAHSLTGDHKRALRYANRGLQLARESGSVRQQCLAGQGLSVAHRYAEQFERAEVAARTARERCRQANDQVHLGTVELELAYLALEDGNLDAAQTWIEDGMRRLREAGWADGILTAEALRARLAAARGNPNRAIELAERLVDRVEAREFWARKADLHALLAEQYAGLGRFRIAYDHRVRQLESRKRALDDDRRRRMAMLEVTFDIGRREQELALLRGQQRVSKLEAESQRQRARYRTILAALGIAALVMLMLILGHVLRDRRHFRRLSRIDGLTRVNNHTRFFDTARRMVEQAHHGSHPLVLVLGDIDHFKRVNDQYGHIAGDRVLRAVARLLCDHFPGKAQVGRIGGEEFAVCLLGADMDAVLAGLDGFRKALATIDYGNSADRLSMSFGIAQLESRESLERLRERADKALYRAKRGGRDTVVAADPSGH